MNLLYSSDWVSILSSIGGQGMIFPREIMNEIIQLMESLYQERAPDVILWNWFSGQFEDKINSNTNNGNKINNNKKGKEDFNYENIPRLRKRKAIRYRYNLFSHIGNVSTFYDSGRVRIPYNPLDVLCGSTLPKYQPHSFSLENCADDDISPCKKYPKIISIS